MALFGTLVSVVVCILNDRSGLSLVLVTLLRCGASTTTTTTTTTRTTTITFYGHVLSHHCPNTFTTITTITTITRPTMTRRTRTTRTRLVWLSVLSWFCLASISAASIWEQVEVAIHRNGEPEACGRAIPDPSALQNAISKRMFETKYHVEAYLTFSFAKRLTLQDSCRPETANDNTVNGLVSYCDAGNDKTPVFPDRDSSFRLPEYQTLPCRFFTREGKQITSLTQLQELAQKAIESSLETTETSTSRGTSKPHEDNKEKATTRTSRDQTTTTTLDSTVTTTLTTKTTVTTTTTTGSRQKVTLDLYAVPAGRVFMFAPSFVGEVFELSHMTLGPEFEVVEDDNETTSTTTTQPLISLEVLSVDPRIFEITNFVTPSEVQTVIDSSIQEQDPTFRLERSLVGVSRDGHQPNARRTSEGAWLEFAEVPQRIRKYVHAFNQCVPEIQRTR